MGIQVITGATGLLGSHLAEQLATAGQPVRALVRSSSDVTFLKELGIECHIGDLHDPTSLRVAFKDAAVVYHAAAKVGDWGTRAQFERETLQGTRNVVDAALAADVGRLVHVSSTSAYGHPPAKVAEVDERYPLGERFWMWDDYTRTKVEAEKYVWNAIRDRGLRATVIRPSWLYGPRDRLSIERIERTLRTRRGWIIGPGTNRMNTVYAGNVADACRLAAVDLKAIGQAYNVTSDGTLTQKQYFEMWADAFGHRPPTRHLPFRLAFGGAMLLEAAYRLAGSNKPPFITRYAVWLLGRSTYYSTEKVHRELGWNPRVKYEEGIPLTVRWWRERKVA